MAPDLHEVVRRQAAELAAELSSAFTKSVLEYMEHNGISMKDLGQRMGDLTEAYARHIVHSDHMTVANQGLILAALGAHLDPAGMVLLADATQVDASKLSELLRDVEGGWLTYSIGGEAVHAGVYKWVQRPSPRTYRLLLDVTTTLVLPNQLTHEQTLIGWRLTWQGEGKGPCVIEITRRRH